jgi:hypothetical protein
MTRREFQARLRDGGCSWRPISTRGGLLHDRGFPELEEAPGKGYPSRVAALVRELQRRWLVWRDELVASGVRAPDALRAALVAHQREWERTAHPEYGASPIRVVADEGSSARG